jgi:hypothetical protein
MEQKFENTLYEYTTREFSTDVKSFRPAFETEMLKEGWERVWADITREGTFAVYRRMKLQVQK